MIKRKNWSAVRSLRWFARTAEEHPNDSLTRFGWKGLRETADDHDQADVDAIYSEVIAKIPAGATKILEIGCGDGAFYRALKAADPGMGYRGIDIVPENIADAETAKGTVTVAGTQSGDTVTIGAVTLMAGNSQGPGGLDFDVSVVQASATVTVASVQAGNRIQVAGKLFEASGSQTASGLDFDEGAGSDILVATSLVAAINDAGNGVNPFATADNAGGTSAVITVTAVDVGSAADIPLRTFASTMVTSAEDLAGGVGSDVEAATSLVAAINDAGNGLNSIVSADNNEGTSAIVTLRAATPGTAGNSTGLTSSNGSRLATSAATLGNGVASGVFEIGNVWEYLAETTADWDFIVAIGSVFAFTSIRERDLLFDLVNSKASKGFIIVADPDNATPAFLASKMAPAIAESVNVAESYYEGARTFLDDSLLKTLFPFYIHRDSTPAAAPADLPVQCRPISTGAFNRALGRDYAKREARKGNPPPADFGGITTTGGLVTGKGMVTIEADWTKGI